MSKWFTRPNRGHVKGYQYNMSGLRRAAINTSDRLKFHLGIATNAELYETLLQFFIEANDIKPWHLAQYEKEELRNWLKMKRMKGYKNQPKDENDPLNAYGGSPFDQEDPSEQPKEESDKPTQE